MPSVVLIGYGAVASYLARALACVNIDLEGIIVRPGREQAAQKACGSVPMAHRFADLAGHHDLVVDCAGHNGLRCHGAEILAAGASLITVATGALADDGLYRDLQQAAEAGNSRLHLASGAIGALDALSAASVGRLERVTYTGRKPPAGWMGSPAQDVLDLQNLTQAAEHFNGTARDCALAYPRNANVAASVALAGLGFDATTARLIADPALEQNLHEIEASGDFGTFNFTIAGHGMPDNPKSSALTAMSVLRAVQARQERITLA